MTNEKIKKYLGTWRANGGATFPYQPCESDNKNKLFRDMKAIAKGETFVGNEWRACVWLASDERQEPILEAGGIVR